MQTIETVSTQREEIFKDRVNSLLEDGFNLSSSSCHTYQFDDYPENTFWTAILLKED